MATTWADREDEYENSSSRYSDEEEEAADEGESQWDNAEDVLEIVTDAEGKKYEIMKKVLKRQVKRDISAADLRAHIPPFGVAATQKEKAKEKAAIRVPLELGEVDEFDPKARTIVRNTINKFMDAPVDVKDSKFARIRQEEEQKRARPEVRKTEGTYGESRGARDEIDPRKKLDDFKKRVRVTNLTERITEEDLYNLLAFGGTTKVDKVYIARDKTTDQYKGFAFVTFGSEKDAQFAIAKGYINFKNVTMRFSPAEAPK
ncbi:translation initiation factor 3 subunit G [Angomonas deanei]|nr:translation initiation factor 3 subunit G [Angomonas deanei]|eukprot:EPY42403.1 translation initiation factor 3 subunit G [Angomonas deanei]